MEVTRPFDLADTSTFETQFTLAVPKITFFERDGEVSRLWSLLGDALNLRGDLLAKGSYARLILGSLPLPALCSGVKVRGVDI